MAANNRFWQRVANINGTISKELTSRRGCKKFSVKTSGTTKMLMTNYARQLLLDTLYFRP